MIFVLDSTAKSIRAKLGEAHTTNPVDFTFHYADVNPAAVDDFIEGSDPAQSNGVTNIEVLAAPAADTRRVVGFLTIVNNDTVSHDIYLYMRVTATDYSLIALTLAAGGWFAYGEGKLGGGGVSSVSWGDILGTLADQTDLQAALDLKATIANVGGAGGWIPLSTTLTYSSADDPTYVVSSNADLTSILTVGNKIKFTNNSTTFYGKIVAIGTWNGSAQLITLNGGTDYDVANSAITAPYYSLMESPVGFPTSPLKWRVTITDTQNKQKTTPTVNTWYGGANAWSTGSQVSINLPIGVWRVCASFYQYVLDTSATIVTMEVTLSSSNNSESDEELTAGIGGNGASSTMTVRQTSRVEKIIAVAAKTPYYLLARTETVNQDDINIIGATRAIIITADLVV